MRTKLGPVFAFLAALWMAILPAGAARAAADFSDVVLSATENGTAEDVFPADTPEIFLRADMVDIAPGSVVTITWLAVDTGPQNPPNFRLNRLSLPVGEKGHLLRTSAVRPGDRWLPGTYRVRLDVNQRPLERVDFTIR